MQTVTVTIGRNVGDEPMAADRWNQFIARTREAVEAVTSELWAAAPSKGEWQGVREDSYVIYGPVKGGQGSDDAFWTDANLSVLRQQLSVLATYYKQDAIGLSVGTPELVESFSDHELVTQ